MAFADDLQNFLETRLQAWIPSIDVSVGSPARVQIIDRVLDRFKQDPLSTDIPKFVIDRMIQEFPDLAADDGGMLEDMLVKPLQLMLEPFKREIQIVKINQSVRNASIMSEDEADAHAANWFEDRDEGDFSSGTVRIYFAQPVTTRVSIDKRLYTNSGLSFFPTQNYFISAQQMLFNRQGSLYYLDVVARAENPGNKYNVTRGEISSIEQVAGVVKVTNLAELTSGRPRETNEEFMARVDESLTERSLGSKRGAVTRTEKLFQGVRAMQVVGAGEEGMNRDILKGTGEGFLHLAGAATIYGDWLWASSIAYRDDGPSNSILPQSGDTIRFHPTSPAPATTAVVSAKILTVLSAASNKYLFLLDKSPYATDVIQEGAFSLFKPGYITISGIPGGISLNVTVPDNTVHLGGHTDIFVRPTDDLELQGTLSSVSDESPLAAIIDLRVTNANNNQVYSLSTDFVQVGVRVGDVLVIETGAGFAGTYSILEIEDAHNLRVDTVFEANTPVLSPLRARIVRNIRVDLIEPHIPKLPFTPGPVSDLQTNVGSNEFTFSSINIQDFGTRVGDTVNILEGPDAGEFVIIGFNSENGAAKVDRLATATGAGLNYQIYTRLSGLSRPLVRLKSLEVLDSTGQGTGINIPYGDAVDVRPTGALEGAGRELITYGKQLIIFPDMPEWAIAGGLPAVGVLLASISQTTDARYTLGLEQADGVVRTVDHHVSNQVEKSEINVPPFMWNGRRDKLLALVAHRDNDFSTAIAGSHTTSDIAKAVIGNSLTIYEGPNQGRYIITDLRVLELWGKTDQGHRTVAVLQIDPPLKVDPIRTAINFINEVNGSNFWTGDQLFGFLQYSADWDNASGFYAAFITKLRTSLNSRGIVYDTDAALKAFFDPLIRTSYSVGPSAKGEFRLFFQEPVSIELLFGDDPTTFDFAAQGTTKKFRVDPNVPPAQIFPESDIDSLPSTWNRNLGVGSAQDRNVFLTSGASFVKRGVQVGDTLEYRPAVLDLSARKGMTSSWVCVTQTGSNIVQLILPPSQSGREQGYGGADNYVPVAGGQLLFIDSGPDIGSYTVVKVVEQDWVSNPPTLKIQIDQPLSHTTENFPAVTALSVPPPVCDFSSAVAAWTYTNGNIFPMSLAAKKVSLRYSIDGGTTWIAAVEHTFAGPGDYASAAAIATELMTNGPFAAAYYAVAVGNELYITTHVEGPRVRVKAVAPTSASAYSILKFTQDAVFKGGAGGVTIPASKRVYGSGLGEVSVGDWITLYAARSDTLLAAVSPDDAPYLGTFEVTAAGTDPGFVPFLASNSPGFVELSRGADFPVGDWVFVRWLWHSPPTTDPVSTSGGGTEISDQFVRFRLYDSVSKKLKITSFPWVSINHPLLDISETQLQLETPGLVDVAGGQKNYSHMSPYRILRPDVMRVSSTAMSNKREGAFYYVDVPVVGYGPGAEMNVSPTDGFVLSGNRRIDGYLLQTDDENLAYSNKERVDIILPNSVLPVGSTADLENKFSLAGQNIQVIYNYAPLVDDIQSFFNSPQDRVTAANILVRHFLPAYVFLDAEYTGGAAEQEVALSIISYLNNVDPNVAEIRSDLVQDRIKGKNASKVALPITLVALFHGIDRRIRGMRSETSIGLGAGTPYFKGTFLQAYFIAGVDTSRKLIRPTGEQIYLVRS